MESFAQIIQIIVLVGVILAGLVIVGYTLINGISPMPSSAKAVEAIVDACKRHGAHGTICELGSGWGGLALRLAREFPAATVVGYENCPVPYVWSRLVAAIARQPNIRFVLADFYKTDLTQANTIVCYLCPSSMRKLAPKLRSELLPGSVVVSSTFAMPGWEPVEVKAAADVFRSKIYLYRNVK